jgi:4-alpha-glucanotransferase
MAVKPSAQLFQLARLYGVQTAYYDTANKRRNASVESVLAVLAALGAPIQRLSDVANATRHRRQELWRRYIEPVIVAWDGRQTDVIVRTLARQTSTPVDCELLLEDGQARRWKVDLAPLPAQETADVEGSRYTVCRLRLPASPPGYHRLRLTSPSGTYEALVISAPRRAFSKRPDSAREWGVFAPLYSLHSKDSWGAGSFTDMKAVIEWSGSLGGSVVGTLPLLASFLAEPFEPSPYAPASRLFWNELYIDVTKVPELERSAEARALLASPETQSLLRELRSAPLVDYRRQAMLQRSVLEKLAHTFFSQPSPRHDAHRQFLTTHTRAEDYARFRAAHEKQARPWSEWPAAMRDGTIPKDAYDDEAMQYHLYAQWIADDQISELAGVNGNDNKPLYLDLPLGAHPDSYDVWRKRERFAFGVSIGAPPDSLFLNGQNWGFPPLKPEASRIQGHRYFIDCLRHHLRYAGMLRLDHIMGLHRLFWVPSGLEAKEGVYVSYAAEEMYAILSLESHRHQAAIVGEDLGTVPNYVQQAMSRHNIQRMYVVQYEVSPEKEPVLPAPPANSMASVNTHDMPTFSAFYGGLDIDTFREFGFFDEEEAGDADESRNKLMELLIKFLGEEALLDASQPTEEAILKAALSFLASSRAKSLLVNLEDLWQETEPQNIPGTTSEYPNWRRKFSRDLESFTKDDGVLGVLRLVDRLRKQP